MKKRKIVLFSFLALLVTGTGAMALNVQIPTTIPPRIRSQLPSQLADGIERIGAILATDNNNVEQGNSTSSNGPDSLATLTNGDASPPSVLNGDDISSEIAQQQVLNQIAESGLNGNGADAVSRVTGGAEDLVGIATSVTSALGIGNTQGKIGQLINIQSQTARILKRNGDKEEEIIKQTAATNAGIAAINQRETAEKLKSRRQDELRAREDVSTGILGLRQYDNIYY